MVLGIVAKPLLALRSHRRGTAPGHSTLRWSSCFLTIALTAGTGDKSCGPMLRGGGGGGGGGGGKFGTFLAALQEQDVIFLTVYQTRDIWRKSMIRSVILAGSGCTVSGAFPIRMSMSIARQPVLMQDI